MTLRELHIANEYVLVDRWNHTAHIKAQLVAANSLKQGKINITDFHPFRSTPKAKFSKDNVDSLAALALLI